VIAYLDASVLLRVVLGQPDALAGWGGIETGVASALVEVECLRTLDRLRLRVGLDDESIAERREALQRLLDATEIVELTAPVLRRASQPFPTALGTPDALHLASALLWRDQTGEDLTVATHDAALALASRACGLAVIGL
jgi:predicted nucleic acid-binding protein